MVAATQYRIVCTTLEYPSQHRHIVAVGTGTDPGKASQQWTVAQVRTALTNGDVFYTYDGSNAALVYKYDCACGYKTIRSAADASTANNLDEMRSCNWTN